jgi:hypothetical protein
MPRKTYTREFKLQALGMITDQGLSVAEVARRLGVATRDRARAEIFDYPEVFYDRVRRHSSLGYVSPEAFERAHNQIHP